MACSGCPSKVLTDPNATAEEKADAQRKLREQAERAARSIAETSLADLYRNAVTRASDINEHCAKLKELAEQVVHVTDIGMRYDASTVSLVAGQPQRMIVVANSRAPILSALEAHPHLRGETDLMVIPGHTPEVDLPEETDLLFLDTVHTANQIYVELTKYAPHVRRWIVRHDTAIYGERGQDGGPGLLSGIRQYLREHPEWSVVYQTDHNHGLTVLGRDDGDKPALPSLVRQGFNFARHLIRRATEQGETVPEEVFNARLDQCATCIHRVQSRCSLCGCFLDVNPHTNEPGKAAWNFEECPLPDEKKRWRKHE